MNYTVIVTTAGITAVARFNNGHPPLGKHFDFGHEGQQYENACTEIADTITRLHNKQIGVEFQFTKDDNTDLETLYRVSTNIARQVEGARTRKVLN